MSEILHGYLSVTDDGSKEFMEVVHATLAFSKAESLVIGNKDDVQKNATSIVNHWVDPLAMLGAEFGICLLNESSFEQGRELQAMVSEQIPVLVLRREANDQLFRNNEPLIIDRGYWDLDGLKREISRYAKALRWEMVLSDHPHLEPRLAVFRNGPLGIDYRNHLVDIDGQEVLLTPIEYRFVAFLARNVGERLTYDHISWAVWAIPIEKSVEHEIRVHLSRIRPKFRESAVKPSLFRNYPGFGYGMVDLATVR